MSHAQENVAGLSLVSETSEVAMRPCRTHRKDRNQRNNRLHVGTTHASSVVAGNAQRHRISAEFGISHRTILQLCGKLLSLVLLSWRKQKVITGSARHMFTPCRHTGKLTNDFFCFLPRSSMAYKPKKRKSRLSAARKLGAAGRWLA